MVPLMFFATRIVFVVYKPKANSCQLGNLGGALSPGAAQLSCFKELVSRASATS